MKKLPIGISDFKEIIDNDNYYVDKTLFIKELLDTSGKVILIPRPRRFGKTLNMSMLKYFFEKTDIDHGYLFKYLQISQFPEILNHQGKYPVIYLTFKDVKQNNWNDLLIKLKMLISREFDHHFRNVKDGLFDLQLKEYNLIREKTADLPSFSDSLRFLSEVLHSYYKTKVIILIDEYDAPIHAGFYNNFYKEVIDFMRDLLSAAFKDNDNLERGVLTGILRTSKEGIFSGLNNLKVASILDNTFQDKFGFTTSETKQMLADKNWSDKFQDVAKWYNGYIFGETVIYNPWSIIFFIDSGKLDQHWVNTSNNKLIEKLIAQSNDSVKENLELLLKDKAIQVNVHQGIIFPGIENDDEAIWSLLLFTGYLTCKKVEGKKCALMIPNLEIKELFTGFINQIFKQVLGVNKIKELLNAIAIGNKIVFSRYLQEFINNSMSYYDYSADKSSFAKASEDWPEKSYHLFVLGMLNMLSDSYTIKSNRESGDGRYDIMLIPKDHKALGVIIEFKKVFSDENETLETAALKALKQIKEKNYAQELRSFGIKKITAFGIAFQKKNIFIADENLV